MQLEKISEKIVSISLLLLPKINFQESNLKIDEGFIDLFRIKQP